MEFVQWIDNNFRRDNKETFEEALKDVREQAEFFKGKAIIVVGVEDVAAHVPVIHIWF